MRSKVSFLLCLSLAPAAALAQNAAGALLIRDVRVFDGERVLDHRSVLVENGKISQVGGPELRASRAEIMDGCGRTLLPGLFDAHVHVPPKPEAALRQAAALGVTTVLDMFGGGEKLKAKARIESEDPPDMADMRAAGYGATGPGSALLGKMAQAPLPVITAPEQAQTWVDARIAEGSDYIKVVYDERAGGALAPQTLEAITAAAHRRGKLVVAHVLAEQKAREAIEAGVDGLVHLFIGDSAGVDFGRLAAAHHVFVVPTLMTLYSLCGKPQGSALLSDPRLEPFIPAEQQRFLKLPGDPARNHLCSATDEAMRELIEAHAAILAGTDTSLTVGRVLGLTAFGATLHGELKLLVDEGLTPVQALAAATSAPARAFRFTDRGLIRRGLRADLVLVQGDPTRDILATRDIVTVWKRGVRIRR